MSWHSPWESANPRHMMGAGRVFKGRQREKLLAEHPGGESGVLGVYNGLADQ